MSEQELWESIFDSFRSRLNLSESGIMVYTDINGDTARVSKCKPDWVGLFYIFERYRLVISEVSDIERDYRSVLAPYRMLYV